jgi:hypothetical protein
MKVVWMGKPGRKNKPSEVDYATKGDYYFSLCIRQETSDPFEYRLFVYCTKGFMHLSQNGRDGFHSIQEAKDYVSTWEDRY